MFKFSLLFYKKRSKYVLSSHYRSSLTFQDALISVKTQCPIPRHLELSLQLFAKMFSVVLPKGGEIGWTVLLKCCFILKQICQTSMVESKNRLSELPNSFSVLLVYNNSGQVFKVLIKVYHFSLFKIVNSFDQSGKVVITTRNVYYS